MINKTKLVDTIEKYYLNGLTESAKYIIQNKTLTIPFQSTNRDIFGKIISPIDLDDAEFGVYDTNPLLKLLNILNKDIVIEYSKTFGIVEKLHIEDNQYKLLFTLSDSSLISKIPNAIDVPYQLTYNIDSEFVTKFIECKKALGSDIRTFTLEPNADQTAKFILGDTSGYANKLEFSINCEVEGMPFIPLVFPSDNLREILQSNKNLDEGIMKVNEGGLMYLMFKEEDVISEYYIMASVN